MTQDPYHDKKTYHMAAACNNLGGVSALCFKRHRSINLQIASWTLEPDAVTCEKCLRILKQQEL